MMPDKNGNALKKKSFKPEERRLFMNINICTACRGCELACSYHHTGMFSTASSSIIIKRNDIDGIFGYEFLQSCDFCVGFDVPKCVEACPTHALCMK